jgi:hypothetical protein
MGPDCYVYSDSYVCLLRLRRAAVNFQEFLAQGRWRRRFRASRLIVVLDVKGMKRGSEGCTIINPHEKCRSRPNTSVPRYHCHVAEHPFCTTSPYPAPVLRPIDTLPHIRPDSMNQWNRGLPLIRRERLGRAKPARSLCA